MQDEIDFIIPTIKTIERPKKTWDPQKQSDIPDQIRPQIQSLKRFIKAKKQKQKKQKQLQKLKKQNQQLKQHEQKIQQQHQKQKYHVNQFGQLVDQNGNLIFIKNQTTDLIINKNQQQKKTTKQLEKKQKIKYHDRISRTFLDRNISLSGAKRKIKRNMLGLQFMQQGSYQPYTGVKIQKQQQIQNDLQKIIKNEINQSDKQIKVIKKRFQTRLQFNKQIPQVQWWDAQIIDKQQYLKLKNINNQGKQQEEHTLYQIDFGNLLKYQAISQPITHQPIQMDKQKKQQKITIPVYLTKDQQKRLKRKRRKQKLIQKNDMIKLGLIQPEKPKLKISNMAIVMKNQFIIDPSKVQAQAKKQQQQRLNTHLTNNAQRKLTKKQKKQKALRKLKRDSGRQCRRIVFKVNNLSNPTHKFKVNKNADQLKLNGFVLMPKQYHSQPVLIMAQGGQKAIRFYRNLMCNRIRWAQQSQGNRCELVWQGQIQSSKLGKWKTIEIGDISQSIRFLTQKGVQNFSQYLY